MRLTNPQLLASYMDNRNFSQARLARYANCSRQFIWQLLNDPMKRTCKRETGQRIEEALGLLPGTLFLDSMSPVERPAVPHQRTRKVAA